MSGAGFASAAAVELLVGGVVHAGWRSMKATLSLDAPAVKFALELAERWSNDPAQAPRAVKPGAACQLRLDGEMVVDGFIDAVEVTYDARDHVLTVVARDKLGDLVDCAAVLDGAHEFAGLRLDEIAARIAAPFGIAVDAEVDPGPPFPRFAIQPGETAWEAIQRAATARGILLAGSGTGVLRLTRATEARPAAGPIEMGANVRRAFGVFDHAGRHSVVCVRGQAEGGGTAAGVHDPAGAPAPGATGLIAARSQARQADQAIGRYRPRVIVAETAGAAQSFADRAAWEVRAAAGRSVRVAYTLPGWRGASGALWRTMTLARVTDRFLGVDADLLISGVVYSLTPQGGSLTELEVTLPDAYDIQAVPLKQAAGAAGGGELFGVLREDGQAVPEERQRQFRQAGNAA